MATLDPGVTSKRPRETTREAASPQQASSPAKKKKKGIAAQQKGKAKTPAIKKTHEPPEGSPLMTIPKAGKKYFGLSKNGSYDAAERGDFGRLYEVGRRKFVVIPALEARIKAVGEAAE